MAELKIGIIDDDESKVTQIMSKLDIGLTDSSPEKKSKYDNYKIMPVEVSLDNKIDVITEQIISSGIQALIIDYKLSSFSTVSYTGIDLIKHINQTIYELPIFVLTSYEDDLFSNEVFDTYQVFSYERYLNEPSERTEINYKIIEQILQRERQLKKYEEELHEILPQKGTAEHIDSRILEIDDILEKSLSLTSVLTPKIKKDLSSNKLIDLIDKIDSILKEE